MFSSVRQFLSRHRRKFLITGAIVGGTAIALQYAQRRLRQFQEAQAREFIERQKRTQHFELTERTCNQAIMGVAQPLCDELLRALDTEPTVQQLRGKPDNRQELWRELKVLSFTRLATLVYACSMLVVSLRVQLNILGGYMYRESVSGGAGAKATANGGGGSSAGNDRPIHLSANLQQTYLSLNQHFLGAGIRRMAALIEAKVRSVLADCDLRQEMSLADVEQVFWSIQRAVNSDETDPSGNMAKFILPGQLPAEEAEDSEVLARLFAETLDMLESEDAVSLNTYNVTRGFSIVMDSIAEFYYEPMQRQNGLAEALAGVGGDGAEKKEPKSKANGVGQVVDITDLCKASSTPITKADLNVATNINLVRLPLAKIIPIVNGLASKAFSAAVKPPSLSTSLVTLFMVSDKVKTLGANVYEVFSQ